MFYSNKPTYLVAMSFIFIWLRKKFSEISVMPLITNREVSKYLNGHSKNKDQLLCCSPCFLAVNTLRALKNIDSPSNEPVL